MAGRYSRSIRTPTGESPSSFWRAIQPDIEGASTTFDGGHGRSDHHGVRAARRARRTARDGALARADRRNAYRASRYLRSACSARNVASCFVRPGERKSIARPCFSVFLLTVEGSKYIVALSAV